MEFTSKNGITLINDAYNASPLGVKSVLKLLAQQNGKKIAILGDMFELGDHAESLHYQVGTYRWVNNLDMVIAIGPLSFHTHRGVKEVATESHYFETKESFLDSPLAKSLLEEETLVILVKASRGMYFEEIVEWIKERM